MVSRQIPVSPLAIFTLAGCGSTDGGHPGRPGYRLGFTDGGNVIACAHAPKDSDGDHISDDDEGASETPPRDTDHDGTPDYLEIRTSGQRRHPRRRRERAAAATPAWRLSTATATACPTSAILEFDDAKQRHVAAPTRIEAGMDPIYPADTNQRRPSRTTWTSTTARRRHS